jgi:hypothetical protein
MTILKNTVLMLGLLFLAVLIQSVASQWWFETFVLNRIHSIYGGVQVDILIDQIPTMLSFLALGALGFAVFEAPWSLHWTVIFGAAGSLFRAVMTQSAFSAPAEVADKINYFATYAYPPLFAFIGAVLTWWVLRQRGTPLTRLDAPRLVPRVALRKSGRRRRR